MRLFLARILLAAALTVMPSELRVMLERAVTDGLDIAGGRLEITLRFGPEFPTEGI